MIEFKDYYFISILILIVFYGFLGFKLFLYVVLIIVAFISVRYVSFLKEKADESTNGFEKLESTKAKRCRNNEELSTKRKGGRTFKEKFHSFLNTSINDKSKMSYLGWKFPFSTAKSPQPVTPDSGKRKVRQGVVRSHTFSGYRSSPRNVPSSAGPLLSSPFLPTVKRVLGLNNAAKPAISHMPEVSAVYPNRPVPGYIPAVRLRKPDKYSLPQRNTSLIRSPNTVKIAPPEHNKLSNSRLYQVKHNLSQTSDFTKTPDVQSVVSALKEKSRKRSLDGLDTTLTDAPIQHSKRRRQDSQHSNASTSSLPPLPESLPDLSTQGYTIPRLETPTLKRAAEISELDDQNWDPENVQTAKKARMDTRYNLIASSLSSSKRIKDKELQKRKRMSEEREYRRPVKKQSRVEKSLIRSDVPLERMDTLILPPELNESFGNQSSSPNESEVETSLIKAETKKAAPVQKRVPLNESFSAKKSNLSLFSGPNKSFQKVPQSSVVANMEDYEKDREDEQRRAKEMLEGLEKEEEDKKQTDKGSEKKTPRSPPPTTCATTVPPKTTTSTLSPVTQLSSAGSSLSGTTTSSQFSSGTKESPSVSTAARMAATLNTPSQPTSSQNSSMAGATLPSYVTASTTIQSKPLGEVSAAALPSSNSSRTPTLTSVSSGFSFSAVKNLPTSKALSELTTFSRELSEKPAFGITTSATVTSNENAGLNSTEQSPGLSSSTAASVAFPVTTSSVTSNTSFKAVFPGATTTAPGLLSNNSLPSSSQSGPIFSLPTSLATSSSQASFTVGQSNSGAFTFGVTSQPISSTSTSTITGQTNFVPSLTTTAGDVNFGRTTSTMASGSSNPSMFSFVKSTTATVTSFGQANSSATTASVPTGLFTFGHSSANPTTTAATTVSTFGATATSQPTAPVFNFGQIPAVTSSVFGFGKTSAPSVSTTASAASFNFGQSSSSFGAGKPAFAPQSTAQGFQFGKQAEASATTSSSFTFGSQNTVSSSKPAVSPSFGAAGQTSGTVTLSFGSNTPTVGSSSAPVFGAPSTSSQPVFGLPASSSAPAFGSIAPSQTSSVSGFGSLPSGQLAKPAFATQSSTSVFGAPQTTAVQGTGFGSGGSFGQQNTSGQPNSVFTFGQQSSTTQSNSIFGSSATQASSTPVFGSSVSTGPGFNQSNVNTSFGAPNTGGSVGNFNFGMSTPQKETQNSTFTFGASTPQNQVRPPLESTPSSGQKGFDFAATPNFNFAGNTNFGAGTPFGASTPTFNMGSAGNTGNIKNRTVAKAKRRNPKR